MRDNDSHETGEAGVTEQTSMHAVAYLAFAVSGTLVGVVIGVLIATVLR